MSDHDNSGDVAREVQIMTTMHLVLSATRASTVYEAVGRSSMYLTTVSMTLVALGFISAATEMGDGFYIFAFVLLCCLVMLGLISFNRVLQTGVLDLELSHNEERIREFYVSVAPGIDRWFDYRNDSAPVVRSLSGGGGSRFQILLTAASMVGGVNSAVIGVLIGLGIARLGAGNLVAATGIGAVSFLIAGCLHLRREYVLFAAVQPRDAALDASR